MAGKKMKGAIGRMPNVLIKLSEKEIEEAGIKGYEAGTFLLAKGLTDERLRKAALTYPKWIKNYSKGYAQYLLKMTDNMNKAIDDGDTSLMRKFGETKLGLNQEEIKDDKKVIIIGAEKIMGKKK